MPSALKLERVAFCVGLPRLTVRVWLAVRERDAEAVAAELLYVETAG